MKLKIIKTKEEYEKAINEIETLIDLDPTPGTPKADHLDVLTVLIGDYENVNFTFALPDPVDAILFRMEEMGLKQVDLVPFMGNKSKVSEVLSHKRPLTLQMIKKLTVGLGLSADILIQEPEENIVEPERLDWNDFPIKEMISRGWITASKSDIQQRGKEILQGFFEPILELKAEPVWRRTWHERSSSEVNKHALFAWSARIVSRANVECCQSKYQKEILSKDLLKEISRLSWFDDGPLLAKEFLSKHGIALVVEPHLTKTKLDGGVLVSEQGPVIGLTLRYDRIDSFWFTLVHELVHLYKHIKTDKDAFIDDFEFDNTEDHYEREADRITRDTFIPRSIWKRSDAFLQRTPDAINSLAKELRIHPAIIAGRIRYESNDFKILGGMVGQGQVRKLFKV